MPVECRLVGVQHAQKHLKEIIEVMDKMISQVKDKKIRVGLETTAKYWAKQDFWKDLVLYLQQNPRVEIVFLDSSFALRYASGIDRQKDEIVKEIIDSLSKDPNKTASLEDLVSLKLTEHLTRRLYDRMHPLRTVEFFEQLGKDIGKLRKNGLLDSDTAIILLNKARVLRNKAVVACFSRTDFMEKRIYKERPHISVVGAFHSYLIGSFSNKRVKYIGTTQASVKESLDLKWPLFQSHILRKALRQYRLSEIERQRSISARWKRQLPKPRK